MQGKKETYWQGSITLYLCLILLVMLSLIAAALHSARLAAGRAALVRAGAGTVLDVLPV